MKTKIIILPLLSVLLLISCQIEGKKSEIFQKLEKTPQSKLTKIESPFQIDVDTITTKKLNIDLPIKNIGKNILNNLYIKTTCDCTTLDNYPSSLAKGEKINVKISVDLSAEKGNFCKTVVIYGTFNPFLRYVNILGYRK